MKKLIALILAISVVFCLSSCEEKEEKIYVPYSKSSVDEFMTVLEAELSEEENAEGYLERLKKEDCYDATPEEIKKETDVRIFKFSNWNYSYIFLEGQIYNIKSLGGWGFMSGVTCDFDSDGNKDILYTNAWGSGIHRTEIHCFNTVTKEDVFITSSMVLDYAHADLIVRKNTQDDGTAIFEVCMVEIDYSTDSSDFGYKVIETIGRVEAKNGVPVFIGE